MTVHLVSCGQDCFFPKIKKQSGHATLQCITQQALCHWHNYCTIYAGENSTETYLSSQSIIILITNDNNYFNMIVINDIIAQRQAPHAEAPILRLLKYNLLGSKGFSVNSPRLYPIVPFVTQILDGPKLSL